MPGRDHDFVLQQQVENCLIALLRREGHHIPLGMSFELFPAETLS